MTYALSGRGVELDRIESFAAPIVLWTSALFAALAIVAPHLSERRRALLAITAVIVLAGAKADKLDLGAAGGRWLLLASVIATLIGATVIALIAKHALHHATKKSE